MTQPKFALSDIKRLAAHHQPAAIYRALRALWSRHARPARWHHLRRLTPLSQAFGYHRGQSLDRYYIEAFLQRHQADIRGHVLEIFDAQYTRQFGDQRVTQSAVLHAMSGNPQATLIGDLATGAGIPAQAFDCMIVTQTLHLIYDLHGAIKQCYAALKPGGVLLATLPGICQVSRYEATNWGDYWRLTSLSAHRSFSEVFPPASVQVEAHGNVLVAVAYLHGLAVAELSAPELAYNDPAYEIVITVRARKPVTP